MTLRTYGVHEATVDVGIEEVGHGEHSTIPQRTQVGAGTFARPFQRLLLGRLLRAVVQQVHEQGEVPGGRGRKCSTNQHQG